MRDINRIIPPIEKLEKLWIENPDLRFGPLILVIAKTYTTNPQLFNMEDDEFVKKIEELAKSLIIKK